MNKKQAQEVQCILPGRFRLKGHLFTQAHDMNDAYIKIFLIDHTSDSFIWGRIRIWCNHVIYSIFLQYLYNAYLREQGILHNNGCGMLSKCQIVEIVGNFCSSVSVRSMSSKAKQKFKQKPSKHTFFFPSSFCR